MCTLTWFFLFEPECVFWDDVFWDDVLSLELLYFLMECVFIKLCTTTISVHMLCLLPNTLS